MTKSDELVKLLAEVDSHCANTFCNTCQYQQISNEYPCTCYAIAQKLIDEGYEKANKTKKKTTMKEFAEELAVKALKLNELECYHICNLIDEVLKEYENE